MVASGSESTFRTSLESILTCPICYDRLKVPVQLPCSHSFCSVCIRNWLKSNKQCPVCQKHAESSNLIPNRIAEQISDLLKRHESGLEYRNPVAALEIKRDENHVSCPNCSKPVPSDSINSHLDTCLKPKLDKERHRQKLPIVALHMVSDKQLRNHLQTYGLSTRGSRPELDSRWSSFVILFEANEDQAHPAPLDEVIRRVEREERARNHSNNAAPSPFRRTTNILGNGDNSFDSLVLQLQQQKKKRKLTEAITASDSALSHSNEVKNTESHTNAAAPSAGIVDNDEQQLPWPWRKVYLPAYGRPMYYNRETREGTFRSPIQSINPISSNSRNPNSTSQQNTECIDLT